MSNMEDNSSYTTVTKGHSNPSRSVAKQSSGFPPPDVGDFVVNEVNKKGTGSLKGQPMAQKRKTTLTNPSF